MAYKSATNPKTGETFVLMGNQWQTVKTATNPQTGETFGLVGTKWEPLGVIDYFKNLYAPKGVGAPLEGPPAGLPAMLQMPQQQKAPVAPGMIPTSEGIQAAEEVAGKGAVAPEFTAGLESYLNSLPEAERAKELNVLLSQPEASPYARAAQVVAEKYKQYDVASKVPTLKDYDPRLEAQAERFAKAGMRAEDAQALAQQQAQSGAFFKAPDIAQPDLVRMEARQYGESLKDAGFLRRVGEEAKSQYTQAGLGMIQFVGDLSGQGRLTRRALQAGREQDALQAAIPKGESQFEQSAQQALASLAVQGPTIAAGIMTGTSAPVIAQTLLQSFGTEYGQGRRANLDPAEAATRAALISSAEGFFERYGLESQFKTLRKSLGKIPTNNLSGVLAKSIATELPAEAATTTAQFLIDKAPEIGLAPNAGMKEFLEAQAETLRQTLIQSNATVAGVYGAGKVAEAFTPESAKAEYRAEQAKQRALGEWEKFGAQFRESAEKAKQRKAAERPEPKLEVGAKGTVGPAYETVEQQQRFDAIVRQHIQYGIPERDAVAMATAELEEEALAKEALIEGLSYPSDEIPLVPTPLTRFTTEERAEPKLGELAPLGGPPPKPTPDGAYERYMVRENRINAAAQELLDSGYTYSTEEAYRLAKQRIDEIEALEAEDAAQAQVAGEPVSVGVGVGPTVSEPTAVPPAAETAPKPKRSRVARTRKTISDLAGAEGEPSAALTEAPTAEAPTAEAPVAEAPTPTPAAPTAEAPTAEAPAAEAAPTEAPVVQAPTPVPGEQSVDKTPDQIKEELKTSAPKTADKIKLQDNDPTIEASAVFAPPAEPTLLNRRNAKDIPATERMEGLPISGGTSEGDIVDPKKRQAKFDEVNYTESKPAMTQDLAGAIESTYPAQTLGNIGVLDYGMTTWLGAHFNGGLFIRARHGEGIKENAPVVGHELGHAAHSLLGDKINKNPRVLEELRAVEDFLYPGLRDKIAAAEGNYDNKFFNYLLSPDELIAEFNVQRLGNPEQAKKVAPILTRLLQSVDNNPGLVKKRKTVPSGFITVLPANGYFVADGMHPMDINTYPPSAQAGYYISGAEKTKTTKNLKKAIQLLESIANPDNFDLGRLGDLYAGVYGDEVKNLAKAAEVYERAAERSTIAYSQEEYRKKAEAARGQVKQKKKKEPKYTPAKGVRFVGSGDYFDVEVNGKMTSVQVEKSLSTYQQYQVVYRKPTGEYVTELFTSLNDAKRRAEEIAQQLVAERAEVGSIINGNVGFAFDVMLFEGMGIIYRQKPSDVTSVNGIIEAVDYAIYSGDVNLVDTLKEYKLQDYTDYAGDAYVSRTNKTLADLKVRDVLQMWAEASKVTVPEVPAGATFKDYGINTLNELKAQRGKAIADVFGAEPKKESKAGRKAATEEERAEAKKARATTSTAYKRAERKLNKAIQLLAPDEVNPFEAKSKKVVQSAERADAIAQLYAIAKAWKGGSADGVGARAAARLAEPDITDKDRAQAKKDYEAKRDAGEEPRGIEFLSIVSPPIMDDLTLAQSDVRRLEREYQQGRLTEEEFADRIQQAREAVQAARKAKHRARGAANFRAELRKAVQNGELTPKEVMLAEWFIQQNPALLDDLGVALEPSGERTPAGQYLDAKQVVLLFKRGTVRTTIVHEILHHLERMLPEKLQAAITKEWMKQFLRARKEAKTPALKEYFEAVYNYNFGEHKTKEARQAAAQEAINVIEENKLDANSLYQYFNPSEFWATNGSDIVAGRYDAIQGGLLQRLKNWLRELAQKLKSTFGMESHGDIIRALDSLAEADGKFQSSKMLARRLSPADESESEYKAIGRRTPAELDADFQRAEQIVTSSETGNDLREGLELLAALKNPSAIAPEIRYGWDALSDGGRRGLTKVLTTDLLAEVNKEDIPELSNTVKLFQAMNGESKELMTAGADLLQSIMRLLGNDPQRIRNYAKAIYKFTISEYDPADPNNAYRHTQMDAMYAALGPKGQQAYNLHKNYYVTMAAQRAQLTQQQISLLPATSQSKQALRLKLKKLYEDGQKITPYFPLHRFGQFWIATGSGRRRQFFTYDSMQQRDRAFEQMAKRMYPNKPLREAREEALNSKRLRMGNSDDFYTDRTLLAEASAMLPEIFSIIDAANFTTTGPNANRANANLKEELKDAFYQLYLETMPEADVRKQFIHREGVPGFSLDVVRSIAKSVMQNSMQLPKLKYAQRLRNSVSQARDSIAERPHLTPYVQEMERRADSALAPPNTGIGMQVAGAANRVAFVFYLSSASSALIQPMSLLITGAPVLWARHGVAATTAELTRLLQFWKTLGVTKKNLDGTVSWEAPSLAYAKGLTPMQQRAVKELSARGLFQSTTAADLYGRPDQPSEEYGSKWEKTKDYTNMVFVGLIQSTERLTREYMALAAFNLSMRKASKAALQALPPNATAAQRQAALDMAFEQAIDEAMLDTNEALMDPAPYNRPLGMQSALGRVLLLFKTFPLHVISYLGLNAVQIIRASNGAAKKEAAYKFFGTMGMLLTFTGLAGSPFIMPAITALAAMFQALGEDDDEMPDEFRDMNFEAWLRSVYLPTAFGKVEIGGYNLEGWADVVDRGLANKLTGWDFASRLGLSDVLYRDPSPTGSTKGDVTNLIIALGGPVPALALRWADAWDAYSVGDYQRAWELSTPALIRNPLVAKRYEEEGVITPTGETIIAQGGLKTSELVGQVIGFAPDIISNTQRLAFEMNKAEKQINIERKKLTKRLEVAIRKEDDELFDAVADDIHKFTLRNPALGVDFDTFIDSVYKKRENLVGSEAGFTITDKNYAWAQDAILRNALRIAAREREMIEEAQKRLQKALQGNPPDMVIRKGQ